MTLFSWLRRRPKRDPAPSTDPLDRVRWIPAADNPFGVDILDCSDFAESMVSVTSKPAIAARFSQLRASVGEHCRGKDPDSAIAAACHLTYPSQAHGDGAIFRSREME